MCGIAGLVAGDGRAAVDEHALRRMTAALAARGPDGEGFHLAPGVGLGHRRLAIIDVEGGRQPLFSAGGQVAVVVNGEIYNFVDLRRRLQAVGHVFRTQSDCETVAHGWTEWGEGLLPRLEGMFALAVWDGRKRSLLIARDRLGEKPLYWAATPGGGLAFASELKSIRHAPGVGDAIDPAALARYLVHEYVPSPMTILAGARKLEPGTSLLVRPGEAPVVKRWWDLPLGAAGAEAGPIRRDQAQAAAELRERLDRAVRARLVSDVPLGVFLSGGIDSSSVAALAAAARGPAGLDTFAVGFEDESFDESGPARHMASHLGTRHHEERLAPAALLELLPAVGRLLDEPLGDASIVPTHLLARFARKHVTVAVGGDGGDELMLGYPTFQAERVARLLFDRSRHVGRAIARLGALVAARLPVSTGYMSLDFKLRQFLKGADAAPGPARGPRRHQAWLASLEPKGAAAVLTPDVLGRAGDDLYDVVDRWTAACPSDAPWDRLVYFYCKGYLADDVLQKVDRATMAVGLESRAPLLDSKVVELACRSAPSLRLKGFESKSLLKRAMRGTVPDSILYRKKHGFAMPIGRWLAKDVTHLLDDHLGERQLREDGLFEPAAVRRLVDEHRAGRADHRKPLWTLLAFQMWRAAFKAAA